MAATTLFAYTGRASTGKRTGTMAGPDAATVAQSLRAQGITPLTIEAQGTATPPTSARAEPSSGAPTGGAQGSLDLGAALRRWWPQRILPEEQMMLTRQLGALLRAGVPILRALAGLQESSDKPRIKGILGDVRRALESGTSLSASLAQHPAMFDGFYAGMVRVGETTGQLDEVFKRLYKHLEFDQFMRQQVKSALRYPMFVVIAMAVALVIINIFVIPSFATVFKGFNAELPILTRLLLGVSAFTMQYWWAMAGALVGAVVLFQTWVRSPVGRRAWHRRMLHLPIAGKLVRKAMLARLTRSFGLAIASGIPSSQALSLVAATIDNDFIAERVEGIRAQVERGDNLLRACALSGIFTPVVLQMIAVGEETGSVDEMLEEVGELYTNDVEYELKTLGQQIEPILVLFMGALVLVLALGVFLPMWELGQVALKK